MAIDIQATIIPKMDFEILMPDGSNYRDSIVFSTWSEMRNASLAERNAMIAARYEQHLIDIRTPGQETPTEEE